MQCVRTLDKNQKFIQKTMSFKTYTELLNYTTFEDRYEYLRLGGGVGVSTFGFDRYINQAFYKSTEWKKIRRFVIDRDYGCDLGISGFEIYKDLLVHHINPVQSIDIIDHDEWILNPEFLITTSQRTHNAIHYGDKSLLRIAPTPRHAGDTKIW